MNDNVRPYSTVIGGYRRLFVKVAILKHARHLNDAPQLNFAPAPANMRSTQGGNQVSGLRLKLQLGRCQASYLLPQLGISSRPRLFDFTNLTVNFFERFLEGLYQLVDCFLPQFQISFCRLLKFFERRVGQLKKRLVVVLERITRKRFKFLRQLFRCLFEGVFSFLRGPALACELGSQLSIFLVRMFMLSNLAIERLLQSL